MKQGVRKVLLSNPYCQSLYTYALHVIQAGEQFQVMTYSYSSIISGLRSWWLILLSYVNSDEYRPYISIVN